MTYHVIPTTICFHNRDPRRGWQVIGLDGRGQWSCSSEAFPTREAAQAERRRYVKDSKPGKRKVKG